MNIDVLKTNCLQDVLEVQCFKNIVAKLTCYKSTNNTLIDLVLTNVHKRSKNVDCILNVLSDFHHLICWSTKLHAPLKINRMITRLCHSLTTDDELLLMQTFILSYFTFCSVIWHYCSMGNLRKVEKLQYKALKFVYNDFTSSYADL